MIFYKKISTAIALLILCSSMILAQGRTGQVRGVVVDTTTSEALFGANVWLDGTSLGAATSFDGDYLIQQVPPGSYTLIVRYIGYQTKNIPFTLAAGQTMEINIELSAEVIEGEVVTVTAQALGQKQAINQQLSSKTISNIVSAEKIHQLPDANAATALSRLPGVSLMNGDQVVIRGVEAKLNQVLINGNQMPSTDMDNRSTNLGFISSNMLSGIEVIKALTPDMDANTVGGVVNLRLREAASGWHFDVLTQGDYNHTDENFNNYKFWASVSNRFLNDKLGVFIQANRDRSDGGDQRAVRNIVMDGSADDTYGLATYLTTGGTFQYDRDIVTVGGGSLILDYKLPNGKIFFQNTYAGNLTDQRHFQNQIDFNNTQVHYTMDRNKYGKDLWINALQAENTFGDVKVEASLSHSATNQYTRIAYSPLGPGNGWTDFFNNSSFNAPFGVDGNGDPIRYNTRAAQASMTWSQLYGIFDNLSREGVDSTTLEGWVSTISNTFKQHLYNTALDVTVPFNFSKDITAEFKAGGKYVRTTRERDFDRTFSNSTDEDTYYNVENYFPGKTNTAANKLRFTDVMETDFKRGGNFLADEYDFKNGFKYVINTDIYDDWITQSMSGWSTLLKQDDSWKDDYNGAESFTAGYFMGTFNILQKLTLIAGLRYEKYNMDYQAQFTVITHSVYGDAISTRVGTITGSDDPDSLYHNVPQSAYNVDRNDENFFPNLHLKYTMNDWSDIRFAYTTGISRPDYLSIIPKVVLYPGNNFEIGNPKLRPTTATNFDLIASFYSNEIGLLTINAFYKELEDVMYRTAIYNGNLEEYANDVSMPDSAFLAERFNYKTRYQDIINTTLNNSNPGYIRGVEIGWQTNFWYLPEPFNSVVLDVNYTRSSSNMLYRIIRNVPQSVPDPNRPGRYTTVYTTVDTTFDGSLLQQAKDVINVALGIDYKGFSGRLSFNMRGNVITSVGTRPEGTTYTGDIYRWDFTIKQELPIDGLSLSLSGVNIFHNAVKSFRNYRLNPEAPVTENLVSVRYSPTIYQLNLRYSF